MSSLSVTKFVSVFTNTRGGDTTGFRTRSSKDSSHIVTSQNDDHVRLVHTDDTQASTKGGTPSLGIRDDQKGKDLPAHQGCRTRFAATCELCLKQQLALPVGWSAHVEESWRTYFSFFRDDTQASTKGGNSLSGNKRLLSFFF